MKKILIATALGGALLIRMVLGIGTAHADPTSQDIEVCNLLDDPTGHELGYTPAQWAFMAEQVKYHSIDATSEDRDRDAARAVYHAAHNARPKHIADLPDSWAGGTK
jgi:hypothetical protein